MFLLFWGIHWWCLSWTVNKSSNGFQTEKCLGQPCCSLWLTVRQNWCRCEIKTCLQRLKMSLQIWRWAHAWEFWKCLQQPNVQMCRYLCPGQVGANPDIVYQNGCFSCREEEGADWLQDGSNQFSLENLQSMPWHIFLLKTSHAFTV